MSRIQVISADLLQRTQFSDLLIHAGYEVEVHADLRPASNGTRVPDAILVNPVMPGASCREVLEMVRSRWPVASVILLRGPGCSSALLEFCDDFLDKDLPADFVLRRVEHCLQLSDFLGRSPEAEDHRTALGLQPRSRFLAVAHWEIARVRRYQGSSVVLRVAIDFFGKLRDLFGSGVAERLHRSLVRTVMKVTRESDLVASWAEDGLAILLTETSVEGALGFLRKLRAMLDRGEDEVDGTAWHLSTVSFGVAPLPLDPSITADSWLALATRALHAAQRSGRNQTRVMVVASGATTFVEPLAEPASRPES